MPQNAQICQNAKTCHKIRKYATQCANMSQIAPNWINQANHGNMCVVCLPCHVYTAKLTCHMSCRVSMSTLCRVESVCRHCVATSVSITGVWKNRHRYIKYLDVSDWITEAAVTWLVISTDCVTNCSYVYVCVRAIHSASRVGQMILFFKNGGFWGHSAH